MPHIDLEFAQRFSKEQREERREKEYQEYKQQRLEEEQREAEEREKIKEIGRRFGEKIRHEEESKRNAALDKVRTAAEEEYYRKNPQMDNRLNNAYKDLAHKMFGNL